MILAWSPFACIGWGCLFGAPEVDGDETLSRQGHASSESAWGR